MFFIVIKSHTKLKRSTLVIAYALLLLKGTIVQQGTRIKHPTIKKVFYDSQEKVHMRISGFILYFSAWSHLFKMS